MFNKGEKATFSKTITESDVCVFAGVSGDFNPIHINKIYAEQTMFKKRIVHGALLNSYISNVIGMQLPGTGTIYLEQNSKFVKPVYIGDTVTASVEIEDIIKEEKGILKLSTNVVNQNGELCLEGYAIVKV